MNNLIKNKMVSFCFPIACYDENEYKNFSIEEEISHYMFPYLHEMKKENNYETQVESALSIETILMLEASAENYIDDVSGELISYHGMDTSESDVAYESNQTNVKDKVVSYSMEKLNDFDYLIQNFYRVDKTTTITSKQLNAGELLKMDMTINNDTSKPQILIYHTHSQEGYVDSIPGDASTTVVGVGEYLKQLLEENYGFNVIHHKGEYDAIKRDSAYSLAGPAIEKILTENPSIEVVIDLHRDGVGQGTHLVTNLDGKNMAKLMFVNGLSHTTKAGDIGYLYNPYLKDNLAFSLQTQLKLSEYYPELARGIYLKGYRFNLHYCPKSLLVEVGAETNTFEEAKNAMVPLADVLNKVLMKDALENDRREEEISKEEISN